MSPSFTTLTEKKHFSKNHVSCSGENGLLQGNHCIIFYKLTHICLLLNHDDLTNITMPELCGVDYKERLEDSSEPVQEV